MKRSEKMGRWVVKSWGTGVSVWPGRMGVVVRFSGGPLTAGTAYFDVSTLHWQVTCDRTRSVYGIRGKSRRMPLQPPLPPHRRCRLNLPSPNLSTLHAPRRHYWLPSDTYVRPIHLPVIFSIIIITLFKPLALPVVNLIIISHNFQNHNNN